MIAADRMTDSAFEAWYTKNRKGNALKNFTELSKEDKGKARERLKKDVTYENTNEFKYFRDRKELETKYSKLVQLLNRRDLHHLIDSINYTHRQREEPTISHSDSNTRSELLSKIDKEDPTIDEMEEYIGKYSVYYGPTAIMKPTGGSAEEYEVRDAALKIELAKQKVEEEARLAAKAKKDAARLAKKAKK